MHQEKAKRIIEQRINQATRNGYMGSIGKLACILRQLGSPVIQNDGLNDGFGFSSTEIEDPYQTEFSDWDHSPEAVQGRIPYFSAGESSEEPTGFGWRSERDYNINPLSPAIIGWHFDGLSRGMHLEIRADTEPDMAGNPIFRVLRVWSKGYMVYFEESGELEAYAPSPEWENQIESLYKVAKAKEKKINQDVKQDRQKEITAKKEGWLDQMRKRWGI